MLSLKLSWLQTVSAGVHLQINDEREENLREDTLFELDVLDLFEFYNLSFFECLKSNGLSIEKREINLSKRARADNTKKLIFGHRSFWVFNRTSLVFR